MGNCRDSCSGRTGGNCGGLRRGTGSRGSARGSVPCAGRCDWLPSISRGLYGACVLDCSSTCPARNWQFVVVGAGFEEVALLDAVRLGQAARTCWSTAGVSTGRVLTRGGRRCLCGKGGASGPRLDRRPRQPRGSQAHPDRFGGLYDRPVTLFPRRSPRNRVVQGSRAGFLAVGTGAHRGPGSSWKPSPWCSKSLPRPPPTPNRPSPVWAVISIPLI